MSYKYETHVHTSQVSACAVSTAAEQVARYKKLGYAGMIVTDHFVNGNSTCYYYDSWDKQMRHFVSGYEDARAEGIRRDFDVFLGWEFTIKGQDFLTYGLDLDFLLGYPGLADLEVEDYSALVRQCGGYLAQAHPFRSAWYMERSGPVDPQYIDGIEVINTSDSDISNKKALSFAEKHNLPVQAGSDCHSIRHIQYSGIILNDRANDVFDIISAIKQHQVSLIETAANSGDFVL